MTDVTSRHRLDAEGTRRHRRTARRDLRRPVNVPLIHQVVVAQLAAARQGTHKTKSRGEVRGGGKKPYRQKGTGRARQGSTRAPQFAGGGVVHGPEPRDYSQRTPKKMKAAALRGALVRPGPRRPRPRRRPPGRAATPRRPRPPSPRSAGQRAPQRPRRASSAPTTLTWQEPAQRRRGPRARRRPAEHLRRAGHRRRRLHPGRARRLRRPARRRRPRRPRVAEAERRRPSDRRRRDEEHHVTTPATSLAPVISEKSYGLLDENKYTFLVHPDANKTRSRSRSRRSSASRSPRQHAQPAGQAQAHPDRLRQAARTPSAPSSRLARATASTSSADRSADGRSDRRESGKTWASVSTSRRRRAVAAPSVADFVEITRTSRRSRWSARCTTRAAATTPAGSPPGTRAAGTSAPTGVIDFRRADKDGVPAKVAHIEYDPNRTARIALLHYADGEKRYIIAPAKLGQGDRSRTARGRHQAGQQPAAAQHPGRHRRCTRSSCGPAAARRSPARPARASSWSPRRAPSPSCACPPVRSATSTSAAAPRSARSATPSSRNINWGKAGRMRWKGKRPTVRGVAMNPVDHPHGGGEGKTSGGRHPVNPGGKPEGRTRRRKASDTMIVRRRRTGKKR